MVKRLHGPRELGNQLHCRPHSSKALLGAPTRSKYHIPNSEPSDIQTRKGEGRKEVKKHSSHNTSAGYGVASNNISMGRISKAVLSDV